MREVIVTEHPFDVWTTLTVKDDLIALKRSTKQSGVNRHSGKKYTSFRHESSVFYSWKNGRMRAYRKMPRRKNSPATFRDVTAEELYMRAYASDDVGKDVAPGFQILFGKTAREVFDDQYPMRLHAKPMAGLTTHLVAKDAHEMTVSMFGNRTRKDLVKAVGGLLEYAPNLSTSHALLAGLSVQGLVPTDWIVKWMPQIVQETNFEYMHVYPRVREARRLFRSMSEKQLRRLVTNGGKLYALADTVMSFNQVREKDPEFDLKELSFTSFKDLHDVLSRENRKRREARVPVEYKGRAKKLPGQYGDYRIVAPSDTWDLVNWGTEMNNCIGGYGRSVTDGRCLLYAVYDKEKMIGNMELDPKGNIRQFVGKHNGGVGDEEAVKTVRAAISEQWPNADTTGGYQPEHIPAGRRVNWDEGF